MRITPTITERYVSLKLVFTDVAPVLGVHVYIEDVYGTVVVEVLLGDGRGSWRRRGHLVAPAVHLDVGDGCESNAVGELQRLYLPGHIPGSDTVEVYIAELCIPLGPGHI